MPIIYLNVGWAIVHVWWKQVQLHGIGQANQKAVLSTASMSMLLYQGNLEACPLRKFLKLHTLRLNPRALQAYYQTYITLYRDHSYISCTHISYSYIWSFVIISISIATVLQQTQMTNQLTVSYYKGIYMLIHVQVSVAKSMLFIHGCGLIYKLQLASKGKSCLIYKSLHVAILYHKASYLL